MIDVLMVKSEAYAWSLSLLTAHEIRGLSTLPTSLRVILPSHSASPSSLPFFRHKASFFFRVWTSFSFTCVASSLSLVHGWFSSVSGLVSSKTPPWPLCQMQLHLFPTPGHLYHITYLFYLYHLLWAAFHVSPVDHLPPQNVSSMRERKPACLRAPGLRKVSSRETALSRYWKNDSCPREVCSIVIEMMIMGYTQLPLVNITQLWVIKG